MTNDHDQDQNQNQNQNPKKNEENEIETQSADWLPDALSEESDEAVLVEKAESESLAVSAAVPETGMASPESAGIVTLIDDPFGFSTLDVAEAQRTEDELDIDSELEDAADDEELGEEDESEADMPQASSAEDLPLDAAAYLPDATEEDEELPELGDFEAEEISEIQLSDLASAIAAEERRHQEEMQLIAGEPEADQAEQEAIAAEQEAIAAEEAALAEQERLDREAEEEANAALREAMPKLDENGSLDLIELQSCIEAILFMSEKPVSLERLYDLLNPASEEEKKAESAEASEETLQEVAPLQAQGPKPDRKKRGKKAKSLEATDSKSLEATDSKSLEATDSKSLEATDGAVASEVAGVVSPQSVPDGELLLAPESTSPVVVEAAAVGVELATEKTRRGSGLRASFGLFQEAMTALRQRYANPHHGFELVEVGGGFQFRTKPGRAALAKKLAKVQTQRLSSGAMETLAIVAYRQPVMKEDIDKVRGVDSSYFIRNLLDKKLIEISGRSELVGRPLLYSTTKEFLELFGLKDLLALPPLAELERMIPASQSKNPEDEDPRVKEMRRLVGEMKADGSTSLIYDPREDEKILQEIRERVGGITTSTPFLEEQKMLEKQAAEEAKRQLEQALTGKTPDAPSDGVQLAADLTPPVMPQAVIEEQKAEERPPAPWLE